MVNNLSVRSWRKTAGEAPLCREADAGDVKREEDSLKKVIKHSYEGLMKDIKSLGYVEERSGVIGEMRTKIRSGFHKFLGRFA